MTIIFECYVQISFGFDVNEELVSLSMAGESTIPSTPLQSGYTTPVPEPVTASDTAVATASTSYVPAPIESYDGAILCYGALEGGYVATEARLVSISASPPFGLINGVRIQNSGIPPPFPAHLAAQVNMKSFYWFRGVLYNTGVNLLNMTDDIYSNLFVNTEYFYHTLKNHSVSIPEFYGSHCVYL